jgi:antitoxin component YwqK of YwqJK toxin-antitoxin module
MGIKKIFSIIVLISINYLTSCTSGQSKIEKKDLRLLKDKCYEFLDSNMYEKMYELSDSLVRITKNDAESYYLRGLANKNLNHFREAINDFTKTISFDSIKAKPYYYRSECYIKINEKDSSFWDNYKSQKLDTSIKSIMICMDFLKANFSSDYIQNKWDQLRNIKVHISYNSNGEKDGKYFKYYNNGKLSEEGTYKNGKLNGITTYYYENGKKKSEDYYSYDVLNGKSREWYDTGELKSEINYKNGEFNGSNVIWFKNGSIKLKGNYLNGSLEGEAIVWNNTTKSYFVEIYKNNELITKKPLEK